MKMSYYYQKTINSTNNTNSATIAKLLDVFNKLHEFPETSTAAKNITKALLDVEMNRPAELFEPLKSPGVEYKESCYDMFLFWSDDLNAWLYRDNSDTGSGQLLIFDVHYFEWRELTNIEMRTYYGKPIKW